MNSATRTRYPLSPKKIIKKTLASSLGWVILYVLLIGSDIVINSAAPEFRQYLASALLIGAVLLLLIILLNYIYQRLYFKDYYYDLNDNFIVIKKGVITPKEISIPYERVQDVYVDQDLLDRIFGLYDVHLSSATYTSGIAAHIDGVGKEAADGLRAVLLNTINEKIHRRPEPVVPIPNVPTK